MRVLVVDEEIPCPLNSGKRLRTFNLLSHLAGKHEIYFLCQWHENGGETISYPMQLAGITTIVVPSCIRKKSGIQFYTALLANLFSRYPYSVTSHYSRLLIAETIRLHSQKAFDLIHCEWTPYAINVKHFFPFPSVVDAHNVESMIWQRNYQVEKNIFKKAYIYLQWKKMVAFERSHLPLFSRVVSVSEPDAGIIKGWVSEKNVDVVSNGVDVEYFQPNKGVQKKKYAIIFTGSLDWRPNVDGLINFLESIFPLIKKNFPEIHFTIVGRNPMKSLQDKVSGMRDVILTGTVDDVRPFMNEASVYVVPLRVGGGSRLKILEALSMELPVISTTIGAEGLDVQNGDNILLADTPEEFYFALSKLFGNSDFAASLGKSGRKLVEARYQWKVLAERLEKNWLVAVKMARAGA